MDVAKSQLQKKVEPIQTSLKSVKEECAAKVQALQTIVGQIGDDPLLAEYKMCIEKDIEIYKKKSVDSRSLAVRMEEKRAYIERERKRIAAFDDELKKMMEE